MLQRPRVKTIRVLGLAVLVAATLTSVQAQRGGGNAPQGAPPAGRGAFAAPPPIGSTPKPAVPNAKPVRSCESLAMVALPNTAIESALVDPNNSGICRVTVIATHPPAGDKVTIWVAIPTSNWNGRFLGNGGGGFTGGSAAGVNAGVALGYASGSTDTGHAGGSGSFALDANGHLNWQSIRDNAHVGVHDMTVTGKALTEAMYGVAPKYSYWYGCSTGGRQGLSEAERYPQDYNGIVAGAPAINWPKLIMQSVWGTVQEIAAGDAVPPCKLAAATQAAVAACDAIDGVKDGVIEDPDRCHYDPKELIGTSAGECGMFTQADADIIRKIWDGPRRLDGSALWYGQTRGADLNAMVSSRGNPPKEQVFAFTNDWLKYWITEDPKFDASTLTPEAYQRYWDQSVEEFGTVIGTDNPDLSAFRDHGGKVIVVARRCGSVDYAGGLHRFLQAGSRPDGRRAEDRRVLALLPCARRRPLRRRSGAQSLRPVGRAGLLGGKRQGSGNPYGNPPRSVGGDSHASAVPVSAGSQVQRLREHRRRGEFRLQRRILSSAPPGRQVRFQNGPLSCSLEWPGCVKIFMTVDRTGLLRRRKAACVLASTQRPRQGEF